MSLFLNTFNRNSETVADRQTEKEELKTMKREKLMRKKKLHSPRDCFKIRYSNTTLVTRTGKTTQTPQ